MNINSIIQRYLSGESTVTIAREYAVDPQQIRYRLKKNGIILRSLSDSHLTGVRPSVSIDNCIFEGSLLGDAGLTLRNNNGLAIFAKRNKYRKHVELVAKSFYGNADRVKPYVSILNGKRYEQFRFQTLHHPEIHHFYKKWYKNHCKIIPSDFELTPKSMLHWFLDDGWATLRKNRERQIIAGFASESFTFEEQSLLKEQIQGFGIECRIGKIKAGTGFRIYIRPSSVDAFYNVIGHCPIDELSYKWK